MPDYLDRELLLALDIDAATAERLLRGTPYSGHDGRPVIEADGLPDLLAQIDPEGCQ